MAPPQPKNRSHVPAKDGQARPPPGQQGRRMASRDAGERAAFFARREAATVLRRVLRGDASKRSGGSIKSLVFSPSVRNKRATFALVCQTLKCKPPALARCHLACQVFDGMPVQSLVAAFSHGCPMYSVEECLCECMLLSVHINFSP
jgi:hypothetical protein